jgi:glucose/arabinose dehydrogenase
MKNKACLVSIGGAMVLGTALGDPAPAQDSPQLLQGKAAFTDWRADRPGLRRHIRLADLPPANLAASRSNGVRVAPRIGNEKPLVPPGFQASLFAAGLESPRQMRVAPNGDVFVVESSSGRIRVLRGLPEGEARKEVFAAGLNAPFGVSFYPPGADPQWVYVANTNSVVRFAYSSGDLRARSQPETVVARLPSGSSHWTRDVVFSNDGSKMFVSVGSASNVAERLEKLDASELAKWNAQHPPGAAWGNETDRADVLEFTPDGKNGRVFATGIRNCVGLAVGPNGDLWCSTNERDALGDDVPSDYITRVKEGGFYGWPWYYIGANEDPRHRGARPDLRDKITVPDVLLQAHSASLGITFYTGQQFPPEYSGNVFAAEHGSWERSKLTGYKVIRVITKDGVPTGEYEDFATGFVVNDTTVWGRPVGVAVAKDGALLVSEDANGTIWRISSTKSGGSQAP